MPRQARAGYVEDPKIRSMRVRTWFRAVNVASKMTAAQLEEEFSEKVPGKGDSSRSCIWDKYRRGETVPRSGRRSNGRPNLVERVEERFPGTAKWLNSPLWRLADGAPVEMAEIQRVYYGLPAELQKLFVMPANDVQGPFWRRTIQANKIASLLLKHVDLDALVTVLAMVREAAVCQQRKQYIDAIVLAYRCFEQMEHHPAIGEALRGELRDYLVCLWQRAESVGR